MNKYLPAQVVIGLVYLIISMISVRYALNYFFDSSKGNMKTCLLLILTSIITFMLLSLFTKLKRSEARRREKEDRKQKNKS